MKANLSVGVMWSDTNYSSFTHSIVQLMQFSQIALCKPGEFIHYDFAPVSWHEMGRNHLVDSMQGEWLLQLDTDHIFEPDLLVRLLSAARKYNTPVLSAAYQYKHPPHGLVAAMWSDDKRLNPIVDWDRDLDVLEVGAVGAGALLVHRDVFRKIRKELNQTPFSVESGLSEDYSFCRRCRLLGIPVHIAPKIESHHIIRSALHLSDYRPTGEIQKVCSSGGQIIIPES